MAALNRARYGELTSEDVLLFSARVDAKLDTPEGIEPTQLFSRNAAVDAVNKEKLAKCPGTAVEYIHSVTVKRGSDSKNPQHEEYLNNMKKLYENTPPAEKELRLRVGAQVMLVANLDLHSGLANGSRGVVVRFEECHRLTLNVPEASEKDETSKVSVSELLESLAGPEVKKYPVVKFTNGRELMITEYAWTRGDNITGSVTFKQIPLKLAYAVSIHRSQGATLDCGVAAIDSGVFEYGQAYVALSRFRNLQGMRLTAFDPSVVRAHPKVVQFYKNNCVYSRIL